MDNPILKNAYQYYEPLPGKHQFKAPHERSYPAFRETMKLLGITILIMWSIGIAFEGLSRLFHYIWG